MSLQAITWAFAVRGISVAQKAVLLALADHADAAGRCWPSLTTLSAKTCAARRTVINALSALEKAGLISRDRQQGGSKSTRYVLHLDRAADALGHDVHLTRAGDAPALGHDVHQGRAPDAPEPSLNPHIESSSNRTDAPRCAGASLARDGRKIASKKRSDSALHRDDRVRSSRLAEGWKPSIDDRRFAEQLGLDPDHTAERFRDYWVAQPGQRGVKANWLATWRNWCRTEADRRASQAGALLRTPTGWQAKVQPTREQLEQSVRHKHANNLLHLLREEEIPVAKALGLHAEDCLRAA